MIKGQRDALISPHQMATTKTCMQAVMKPKRQIVVQKVSQLSLLQEICSENRNPIELEQQPPGQELIMTKKSVNEGC